MKGFEEFEPIFGKANAEWDSRSSTSSSFLPDCLFHVHALDASRLRIHATDFHSYTWESILPIHKLEDLRDDVGVGGSWAEFVDYLVASLKSDDVKLVVRGGTSSSAGDHGATSAKLVARRSKGMPLISISLDRLMSSSANDAMANLSLELFKVFKKQERCCQLPKNSSTVQEGNGGIQDQFDATLFSKKQKLQKIDSTDKALPYGNPSSNLKNVPVSDTPKSPEKSSTQGPLSRKVVHRVAPANRRARVRGAILQDTEDDESK